MISSDINNKINYYRMKTICIKKTVYKYTLRVLSGKYTCMLSCLTSQKINYMYYQFKRFILKNMHIIPDYKTIHNYKYMLWVYN